MSDVRCETESKDGELVTLQREPERPARGVEAMVGGDEAVHGASVAVALPHQALDEGAGGEERQQPCGQLGPKHGGVAAQDRASQSQAVGHQLHLPNLLLLLDMNDCVCEVRQESSEGLCRELGMEPVEVEEAVLAQLVQPASDDDDGGDNNDYFCTVRPTCQPAPSDAPARQAFSGCTSSTCIVYSIHCISVYISLFYYCWGTP